MSLADLFVHGEGWPALLLAPGAYAVLRWRTRARERRLQRLVGPRAAWLAAERGHGRRRLRHLLFAGALLLAVVAALGPRLFGAARPSAWRGVDVVVCLDVSRSMRARDEDPDRLTRAQGEIRALAKRAGGDRLGLVVFAGEARLLVPLTRDLASLATLADLADPSAVRVGGTDLGAALDVALEALAGRAGEHAAILLVTDGEDLAGRGLQAARACRERGVAVHALGLGDVRGSKITVEGEEGDRGGERFLRGAGGADVVSALDRASLERIAAATGGAYVEAGPQGGSLVGLYEDRILPMAKETYASSQRRRKENGYPWPLLLAFLLWTVDLALTDRIGG